MFQELEVLSGVNINPYIIAMYKSWGDQEVDSKAFYTKHIVTHQHIYLLSVNQMQLVADGCMDFTGFLVNIRDIDHYESKQSWLVIRSTNASDF